MYFTSIALDENLYIAWLKHKNILVNIELSQLEHLMSSYSSKGLDSF